MRGYEITHCAALAYGCLCDAVFGFHGGIDVGVTRQKSGGGFDLVAESGVLDLSASDGALRGGFGFLLEAI
jgi:hypothetical protein